MQGVPELVEQRLRPRPSVSSVDSPGAGKGTLRLFSTHYRAQDPLQLSETSALITAPPRFESRA